MKTALTVTKNGKTVICDAEKGESVLALPEHRQPTNAEVAETMPMEDSSEEDLNKGDAEEKGHEIAIPVDEETTCSPSPQKTEIESTGREINEESKEQSFVEEALEMFKECPIPEHIDVNAPYYIECSFVNNGSIEARLAHGRNLDFKDLEEFRSASETYVRFFLKKEVRVSTDDYLVYDEGTDSIRVRFYHFPERTCEDAVTPVADGVANKQLSAIEEEDLKEKRRVLKKAIKQAKEMSFSDGTDANVPFYDRYTFHRFLNIAELQKGPERFNEDATALSEIMPAFETFAKHYIEGAVVLSKDNCVAAMVRSNIYLVLFNIPKIPAQKKRRGVKKSPKSVIKEMSSPVEDPLITKAVEMTKALPAGNGTDVNAPYFTQCDWTVTGDGGLIAGRTFSGNVDSFEKIRAIHQKCAKTFRSSQLSFTDDYTAYIWNEGKNLSVFYYNRGKTEMAA